MPIQAGAATKAPRCCKCWKLLPNTPADTALPLAFPVQWVEKFSSSSDTSQGRRVFWGRVAAGSVRPARRCRSSPAASWPPWPRCWTTPAAPPTCPPAPAPASSSTARWMSRAATGSWPRPPRAAAAGRRRLWRHPAAVPAWPASRELRTTVAWMDDEPLVAGRVYWALHGHRWVKAKVRRVVHKLNINTLAEEAATQLEPNAIGHVELLLQEPIPAAAFEHSARAGLADPGGHRQPQDRWRRAGELTQRIKPSVSPAPPGSAAPAVPAPKIAGYPDSHTIHTAMTHVVVRKLHQVQIHRLCGRVPRGLLPRRPEHARHRPRRVHRLRRLHARVPGQRHLCRRRPAQQTSSPSSSSTPT
jgi:hypothetical protein